MKNDPQMTFTVLTSHFNININYDFVRILWEMVLGIKKYFSNFWDSNHIFFFFKLNEPIE